MSGETCIIGENSGDIDEKCGGRPVGGGSSRDEWKYPSDVEQVEYDGDCEVTLI